jgi:hypothetical protein
MNRTTPGSHDALRLAPARATLCVSSQTGPPFWHPQVSMWNFILQPLQSSILPLDQRLRRLPFVSVNDYTDCNKDTQRVLFYRIRNLLNISSFRQLVIKGVVILLAVYVDILKKQGKHARA